jgi:hypothetical protein
VGDLAKHLFLTSFADCCADFTRFCMTADEPRSESRMAGTVHSLGSAPAAAPYNRGRPFPTKRVGDRSNIQEGWVADDENRRYPGTFKELLDTSTVTTDVPAVIPAMPVATISTPHEFTIDPVPVDDIPDLLLVVNAAASEPIITDAATSTYVWSDI